VNIKEQKMWLNKDDLSWYCYNYSTKVILDRTLRKHITDSHDAYHYCREVEDDPIVRKNITDPKFAYFYCVDIKDRPEIRKYITNYKYLKNLAMERKWGGK